MTVAQLRELHAKLAQYESQKIGEIWAPNTNNHVYSLDELPSATYKRLAEIQHDDEDAIYTLRLGGKYRVAGVLHKHVFYVLWIDPQHEVWPSTKKLT